jgi:hypothetical protein
MTRVTRRVRQMNGRYCRGHPSVYPPTFKLDHCNAPRHHNDTRTIHVPSRYLTHPWPELDLNRHCQAYHIKMPGLIQDGDSFQTLTIKELHPNFGAEVAGVDFPNPSEEQFQEILKAMAKVCQLSQHAFHLGRFRFGTSLTTAVRRVRLPWHRHG